MPSAAPVAVAVTLSAPWGPVHLGASARGIVAVELMTTPEAFQASLERRLNGSVRWIEPAGADRRDLDDVAVRHLRFATRALNASFGDDTPSAPSPEDVPMDLDDRPAWDRAVLGAVRAIPRGEVRSYGEVARAIGRPGAARAVGAAVGRNPVALLVPCHRVVAGDGTLGGYGGGWWGDHDRLLDLKADLLAREGISLPRTRSRGAPGR